MKIRQMEEKDTDVIRKLDSKVFLMPEGVMRKKEQVISCLRLNPEGCFVAEEDSIIGYVFSRKWGEIGWIGVFGVHPNHQGQGIGKRLLNKAKTVLLKDCSVIGLTTPAKKTNNIGMYISENFNIASPTFYLKNDLNTSPHLDPILNDPISIKSIEEDFLKSFSNLSSSVVKGLNYDEEIKRAIESDWDEVLYFDADNFNALAILRKATIRENQDDWNYLQIKNLVIDSREIKHFLQVIKYIENIAIDMDLGISIPVNEVYPQILQYLIKNKNYRLAKLYIRLISKGTYKILDGVDISLWIM